MHLRVCAICCLLLAAHLPAAWQGGSPAQDSMTSALRKAGIEPSYEGLEKYLQSVLLTAQHEEKIRKLVAALGDDLYRTRQKASAELLALPPAPELLLKEAEGKDLETRSRIRQILESPVYAQRDRKLFLALSFIENGRIKGLAPLLLELMPQWQEPYLSLAAARAVEASSQPGDAKALRRAMAESRSAEARAAAVAALALLFEREVENELVEVLKDKAPSVVFAAATALLNLENRKPLAALVDLLEAPDAEVRYRAACVLWSVTGKTLDFASHDEPGKRAVAVAGWRDWVSHEGATAKLKLPVAQRLLMRGRVLAGVQSGGGMVLREIEIATGQTTFEAPGFSYLWGCHATLEGHRLAAEYSGGFVVEYDGQGKECWRQKVPGKPTSVERQPNGRTLVALAEPGLLVELDRSGEVVWQLPLESRPTTAQRLANGNILVCLQFAAKVVELDPLGKEVWAITGLARPHTAQQLPGGNVLVCDFGNGGPTGLVNEYDREGKVVWSKPGIVNPAQAQRLPNGNTLISGNDGLMEFDPQGKEVRRFQVSRCRFFAF